MTNLLRGGSKLKNVRVYGSYTSNQGVNSSAFLDALHIKNNAVKKYLTQLVVATSEATASKLRGIMSQNYKILDCNNAIWMRVPQSRNTLSFQISGANKMGSDIRALEPF